MGRRGQRRLFLEGRRRMMSKEGISVDGRVGSEIYYSMDGWMMMEDAVFVCFGEMK